MEVKTTKNIVEIEDWNAEKKWVAVDDVLKFIKENEVYQPTDDYTSGQEDILLGLQDEITKGV